METKEKEFLLTALDRCDKCSAQAWVVAKGPAGVLNFCGHHYEANQEALKKWAISIVDERHRLTND